MLQFSGIRIGFVNPVYNVSESSPSLEVCVALLSGQTDINIDVSLSSQSRNAQGILKDLHNHKLPSDFQTFLFREH